MAGETVLTNHYVVRDGSYWTCLHCKGQWPFPAPVPRDAGPCVPRGWADGVPPLAADRPAPVSEPVRPSVPDRLPRVYRQLDNGPSAIDRQCPECGAEPGRLCIDGRKIRGTTLRPHVERL